MKNTLAASRLLACTLTMLLGMTASMSDSLGAAESPAMVGATTVRPIHPLLVRNDLGAMLRVTIDVPASQTPVVRSLTFRLDGAGDLESLALASTGDKETFSAATLIGAPQPAAAEVVFRCEEKLQAGKNVFWLAGRVKPTADLSHRVAATCPSIETSAGPIAPAPPTSAVGQHIGFAVRRAKDDGVHTYRIPALTTSVRGSLLCAYDMRRRAGRDLQEDIDIGLSRSTDGGRNWEPVRVIMDMGEYGGKGQELNGCSDPGLIVDRQTGEIFCFALWMFQKPGKHQWVGDGSEPGYEIGKTAQFMMVRSKDDGRTWSKPENLTRALKNEAWWLFAPSPQQGFQLADGTLVMPSQGRDEKGKKFSTIMTSRDHGATWTVGAPAHMGGSECQAVELGDGSLMLNIRNDLEKFRAVQVTRDLGATWQPHATNRNTLIEPTCNASLLRVDFQESGKKKHVLLFANPHTQKTRTHQTIQVSFDDGRTWPETHHLLLDEGRGAGYPSLTQIDDRNVGLVYEGSQAHVVFERFSLDELLAP